MFLSTLGRGVVRFIRFDDEEDAANVESMENGEQSTSRRRVVTIRKFKGCVLLSLWLLVLLCFVMTVILGKSLVCLIIYIN